MVPVHTVIDFLARSFETRCDGISAYWVEVHGSRSIFCTSLSEGLKCLPILAVPVGQGEFADANGIIDDLSRLLERQVSWFSADRRESITKLNRFTIILVSRRPLGVPQISSPVELPDWFPMWPGNLLTISIRNITHLVDVSIGDPLVPILAVASSLYALELALQNRLRWVLSNEPTAINALWNRFAADKGTAADLNTQIAGAANGLKEVSDPGKFRPGGGTDSPYVISRIFRLWWKSSPDDLHKLSEDFAAALHIKVGEIVPRQYSLSALLSRTAIPPLAKTPTGVTFCRNAIVSLANAMQITTAAAHAGDYPRMPAILAANYAQDIARSCQQAADALESIESPRVS